MEQAFSIVVKPGVARALLLNSEAIHAGGEQTATALGFKHPLASAGFAHAVVGDGPDHVILGNRKKSHVENGLTIGGSHGAETRAVPKGDFLVGAHPDAPAGISDQTFNNLPLKVCRLWH